MVASLEEDALTFSQLTILFVKVAPHVMTWLLGSSCPGLVVSIDTSVWMAEQSRVSSMSLFPQVAVMMGSRPHARPAKIMALRSFVRVFS